MHLKTHNRSMLHFQNYGKTAPLCGRDRYCNVQQGLSLHFIITILQTVVEQPHVTACKERGWEVSLKSVDGGRGGRRQVF